MVVVGTAVWAAQEPSAFFFALPADAGLRMAGDAVVLGDLRHAVVVVVVGVGDVGALTVLEFNLEAMADAAGVVDGVEVVDAAIGDAGLGGGR